MHLNEEEIGTLIHYPQPPHLSGAYQDMGWKSGDFPITEEIAHTALSLPIGPHLTPSQQDRVIQVVADSIHQFSS